MKKTIIALMALAGVACADTINPLTEGTWTTGSRLSRPTWVLADGSLTLTNSNWSQAYAIYDLDTNLTGAWKFTSDIYRYNSSAGFTITLVGLDKALAIGTKDYGSGTAYWGTTTNVTAKGYSFQDALGDISGTQVTTSTEAAEGVFNYNQTAKIAASTALDADSNVILTLSIDGTAVATPYTTTINMGKNFTLDKISVWGDGANNASNWSVTGMTISSIPEPTTATLSLLALAGLAARRRRK